MLKAATKMSPISHWHLLQLFERFFAFLRHEGVEPTNNVAERALRCAVQWRKISFRKSQCSG